MIAVLGLLLLPMAAGAGQPVELHVFDAPLGHAHAEKVLAIARKHDCASCKVIPHAIYTAAGELKSSLVLRETEPLLQAARREKCKPRTALIAHFSVNIQSSDKTKAMERRLEELAGCGVYVVAAAGENPENRHRMLKLSDTVMGRVKGVLLIGEKDLKGNLAPRSNYGPEIFLKLSPPSGEQGSSYSAARFSAELAKELADGKSLETLKGKLSR